MAAPGLFRTALDRSDFVQDATARPEPSSFAPVAAVMPPAPEAPGNRYGLDEPEDVPAVSPAHIADDIDDVEELEAVDDLDDEPLFVRAEPKMAQPEMVEAPMAQPLIAQPVMAEPPMAQPMIAEPEMTEPEMAEPKLAEPMEDDDEADSAVNVAPRQFMAPRNANVYAELSDLNDRAREEDEARQAEVAVAPSGVDADASGEEDADWSDMPTMATPTWRREDDDIIPSNAAKRRPTRGRGRSMPKLGGSGRAPRERRPKKEKKQKKVAAVAPVEVDEMTDAFAAPVEEVAAAPVEETAAPVAAEFEGVPAPASVYAEAPMATAPVAAPAGAFSPPSAVFANVGEPSFEFAESAAAAAAPVAVAAPVATVEPETSKKEAAPKAPKEGGRLKRLASMEIKMPKRGSAPAAAPAPAPSAVTAPMPVAAPAAPVATLEHKRSKKEAAPKEGGRLKRLATMEIKLGKRSA